MGTIELAIVVVVGIALVAVTLVTFVRVGALQREVDDLRRRLDRQDLRGEQTASVPAPASIAATSSSADAGADAVMAPPPIRETRKPLFVTPELSASAPVEDAAEHAAAPLADGDPEQFERQIGERLLLYAGMVVLVLGVAFFLRYAFERAWLSPFVRVLLGGVTGAALIAGGLRLARSGYRQYGLFFCGGGLAVFFLSAYAAFALYALIDRPLAFALLVIVAAGAALLADREASLPLAFMSVGGGFATPFLVGGSGDTQITLFFYVAVLIGITMYLARRRGWPLLNLASLVLTLVTVLAWAVSYYTDAAYLRTELFLTLYCAMFAVILRENVRSTSPGAHEVTLVLWCAPIGYHLASLALLNGHGLALLIYLLLAGLTVVIAAAERHSSALRLAGWFLIALPLALWTADQSTGEWRVGATVTAVGVWVLFLAAHLYETRQARKLDDRDTLLLHVNGLGLFVTLYQTLRPVASASQLGMVAALCAVANAGVWALTRRTDTNQSALHWLAVAASLAAMAVAVAFSGQWIVVMWAAESASVMWLAITVDRRWFRRAALVLMALAVLRWLQPDIQNVPLPVLVLANARALSGLTIIALLYVEARLLAGIVGAAHDARYERAILLVSASALTVFLISVEIVAYWARPAGGAGDAPFARSLMLSASWAAYAAALIVIGMRRHYAPIRYFAIALFGLTLTKVFVIDLQQLGGLYRVAGFVVVGVILLLVSFLYQRSRAGQESRGSM